MGGHGGLNILPQKRWNVYNYENREKVRRDEEAAAREEQLKREETRKREAEFRLEALRRARGLAHSVESAPSPAPDDLESYSEPKSNHINLFEGIRIFDPVRPGGHGDGEDDKRGNKKMKIMKKEAAAPRVVTPEDEKFRLGYGIAGKGVKLPWYMAKPSGDVNVKPGTSDDSDDDYHNGDHTHKGRKEAEKVGKKKTMEDLREERLRREKTEKERERALLMEKRRREGAPFRRTGFSSRR